MPVYRGEADTLRAIHRVLTRANRTPFELIVIDDCSPEPALSRKLQALAAQGLFTYLRNEHNLGFVDTVNRGMAIHSSRDVLLLNSDTEVFGDWLDRIMGIAGSAPRCGTITPFSNNATICSYPTFAQDNEFALEISYEELDAIAASENAGKIVELPTGVGFCMYIRRACLEEIGLFDTKLFGKGYGEENDFCRRAVKGGWTNAMACEIFVRHTAACLFKARRQRVSSEPSRRSTRYIPSIRARFVNSSSKIRFVPFGSGLIQRAPPGFERERTRSCHIAAGAEQRSTFSSCARWPRTMV